MLRMQNTWFIFNSIPLRDHWHSERFKVNGHALNTFPLSTGRDSQRGDKFIPFQIWEAVKMGWAWHEMRAFWRLCIMDVLGQEHRLFVFISMSQYVTPADVLGHIQLIKFDLPKTTALALKSYSWAQLISYQTIQPNSLSLWHLPADIFKYMSTG